MNALTTTPRTQTAVGKPTQLGAYSLPGQNRVLIGQRIDGVVRISDQPATGAGRRYLVERGLEQDGRAAVEALVADYLDQAARHQVIPAQDTPVSRYLRALS
jgi:hypothetical protein